MQFKLLLNIGAACLLSSVSAVDINCGTAINPNRVVDVLITQCGTYTYQVYNCGSEDWTDCANRCLTSLTAQGKNMNGVTVAWSIWGIYLKCPDSASGGGGGVKK